MTTHFETAPTYCPMCSHSLGTINAIGGFEQGNICNCSSCQFEYIKAPDPIDGCSNGHEARYRYSIPGFGEIRCTMCDLKEAWTRTAMLEAIIETDHGVFDEITKRLREDVIEMIRAEARAAVIDAYTTAL